MTSDNQAAAFAQTSCYNPAFSGRFGSTNFFKLETLKSVLRGLEITRGRTAEVT
jgi:hypothetical protein